MAYPDSRVITVVDGSTPVGAAILNPTQDEILRLRAGVEGGDFVISDDFVGTTFSDRWTLGGGSRETVIDDSANGGYGSARLLPIAGSDTASLRSATALAVASGDFSINHRVRTVSQGTSNTAYLFGLMNAAGTVSTGSPVCRFVWGATTNSGRWSVQVGDSGAVIDTGVGTSTSYQRLEIRRKAGYVTALIDGTAVFGPALYSVSLSLYLSARLIWLGGAPEARIDSIKMWAPR